jgi:dihydrofolate reductase
MRKVLLNVAITLDGFIAGPNGEYDWCFTDADYGMTGFLQSVDTIIMGRKSYEIAVQYGEPYPDKEVIVFSATIQQTPFQNVKIINGNIPDFVKSMTLQEGKNIWLYGGAVITEPLIENNLIDEFHLAVHPIILGDGIPLFKNIKRSLTLIDSITYPSGLVQSIYKKI